MANSIADLDLLPLAGREGEALFARDEDSDALVRQEKKTQADFAEMVSLTIDGFDVKVPRATPVTDAQGNPRIGPDGKFIPRATTIYDAAGKVFQREELSKRIPVLCHQEHVTPVAVCRMCSVHVSKIRKRDKKLGPSEKLVPACQHEVQDGMVVTTRQCDTRKVAETFALRAAKDGMDPAAAQQNGESTAAACEKYADQVNGSLRLLSEMLFADHLHPDPARDDRYRNELQRVGQSMQVDAPRDILPRSRGRNDGVHPKSRPINLNVLQKDTDPTFPYSARTITVDHDRCILCDRCVRACSEVKPFQVIGHTGKGYQTRISFDLDLVMNESSCVQCGECMNSCPTGALTLRRRVAPVVPGAPPIPVDPTVPVSAEAGFLSARQIRDVVIQYTAPDGTEKPFKPFATIPLSYLKWNEGAVRRRRVKKGDVLFQAGEYGNTALLLEAGTFEVQIPIVAQAKKGFFGRVTGGGTTVMKRQIDYHATILGDLAVLSNKKRTATVVADSEGVVYEVTRNLLDMAQRSAEARDVFNTLYRRNAVRAALQAGKVFKGLTPDQYKSVEEYLDAPGVAEFKRVRPGETIVAEGDEASDFYLVRVGFVKVSRTIDGKEQVLAKLTENDSFGEMALLGFETKRRSASVVALDPVELVRIPGEQFLFLCESLPEVRSALIAKCQAIKAMGKQAKSVGESSSLTEFVEQGLYQAQKVLVLDLESCTRCDECTRACADSHGDGISRLLREGMRFGQFLVATSCRSCHKPYCMDGCPVDAIHREGSKLEIQIDNSCIGCGLCSANCPYGAIQMVPKNARDESRGNIAAVAKQAVNCDLCHGLIPDGAETFCVSACPHEAAFRWDGEFLLNKVQQAAAKGR